jgi:predicted Rossmann fold nucleotide-binding protein DprA/Smf involved in DNA uptake
MSERYYGVEVKTEGRCTFRDATPAELKEALQTNTRVTEILKQQEQLEAEYDKLQTACQHTVFYDTAGWPYDFRTCAACGTSLGSI